MPASYTLPLDDPSATLEAVGGKGASLARLSAAGLPVPGGFHLTTAAYRQFVAENDLQPAIADALRPVNAAQPETLETAARILQSAFCRGRIPTEIAQAITEAYAALPGDEPAVAVRSSATAEDLPGLSFAGQQETYLNVRGHAAVLEAAQRCWASLWTARAIGYRAQNQIDHHSVSLAVTVQLLVAAEAAGIAFTAHPISGQRDQMLITATWGLGEAIVGGQVTPDTLTVEKASGQVLKRETADKQVMTVRTASGTAEQPTPETLRRAPVLNDAQAAELTRLAVQIEQLYGMPMDIEWTWTSPPAPLLKGEGGFAIVQARPITALPPAPVQWARPNPRIVYARGSLAEHLPNPVTPLFGTLGLRLANRATDELCWQMFKAGAETISYEYVPINGYTYLSVALTPHAVWLFTKASFAFLKPILTTGTLRWREARDTLREVVERWAALDVASLSAARLLEGASEIMLQAGRFYTVIQSGTLPTASSSEVIFARVYNSLVKRKGDPEAPAFLFGFDTLAVQAEQSLFDLAVWIKGNAALLDYMRRTPAEALARDLAHEPALGDVPAETWAEWRARFQQHLERFGHMVYEFDFSNPTPAETPQPLLEAIKLFLGGQGVSPYERQRAAIERREQATRQVLARLGWPVRDWFTRALKWAQTSGPLREESLADLGLGHPQIRRLLGELGRRFVAAGALKTASDIYWLVEDEVNELVQKLEHNEPLPDFSERVPPRRAEWHNLLKATPPATLPERSLLTRMLPWARNATEGNIIHGLGASTGKVTGTARVLFSPEDFGRMKAGEVLVAVITTPAWTPLFALASAVVTDIGGPLSHSSIVAREYGIPAVLATGLGTRRIRDGQTVTVDGGRGIVELVP